MKQKYLIFGFLAALALGSCTDELDPPQLNYPEQSYEVQLYNSIEQVATSRVNDEGFCDGDAVGVYVVNYSNGAPGTLQLSGNQADNIKYVYTESNGKWTPETPVYFLDRTTHVDIYGYYPYSSPTSTDEYPFEVAKNQSTDAANGQLGGYEASDFLWGKAADIEPTAQRIPLQFRHMMAGVVVSLAEGEGFAEGEFATLEKSVLVCNTIRKASINLSTGAITPVGDVPNTATVPYKSESDFRAVVVPQTVAAGLPLFSLTVDGTPYVFRKNTDFGYTSGKLHKFTITVSKKGSSGLEFELLNESITAWETDNVSHDATAREYIIIDCPTPGTLKDCIVAAGKNIAEVKNLKLTGTIDKRDFDVMRDEMTKLQSINLKEVTIAEYGSSYPANEIPRRAFYQKSTLVRFVFPDNITAIGYDAFHDTNLTGSLIIPNGVTRIEYEAFLGCAFSGTLSLPNSLKYIGLEAFTNCSGFIGNLNIPDGVTEIGSSAFSSCAGFSGNLILPDGLTKINSNVFNNCTGFTGDLVLSDRITEIGEFAFNRCSGLSGFLKLPKYLTVIPNGAFNVCSFRGTLELPEELVVIGEDAFFGNDFSGDLKLPETLSSIGNNAFSNCNRLTGTIEFPEDIISISPNAFAYCSQLEGVKFSKNLESIRENAFVNCFQLSKIICDAQEPPLLAANAFAGVAKDNFTVEVPESAVATYSTAVGWNEFKRFAAYRDFSISRNLLRTLNAEYSKNYILRAPSGEAWSIESKPDWLTVTPASGTGKTELTVTVSANAQGAGMRSGEIVFLLDGKDYRTRMTVEQYDYTYSDGDVLTVQSASIGAGVDLVFMGDCFDAKDISEGKYLDAINEAIGYFFAVEPYKTYRNYFNVYAVFGMSPESGVGTVNTIRESKFGSAYTLGAGISPNALTCFEYACKAPTVTEDKLPQTLITLVENTEEYGGICWMYADNSAIAICPMSRDEYPYDFRGIVQHEAGGHGFGKLGDEYIYHNSFIQSCGCNCCEHVEAFNDAKSRGWYANLSLSGNMHEVSWSHLIFDPMYSNLVDIYEGGFMHMRGVFRSEINSCMNNNIPYYSAISREAIVKRIKEYAGETYSFEDFKANDVLDASVESLASRGFTGPIIGRRQHAPVIIEHRPMLNLNNR